MSSHLSQTLRICAPMIDFTHCRDSAEINQSWSFFPPSEKEQKAEIARGAKSCLPICSASFYGSLSDLVSASLLVCASGLIWVWRSTAKGFGEAWRKWMIFGVYIYDFWSIKIERVQEMTALTLRFDDEVTTQKYSQTLIIEVKPRKLSSISSKK